MIQETKEQPRLYTTGITLQVLNINRGRFDQWQQRGIIRPTRKASIPEGIRAGWSFDDLVHGAILVYFISGGASISVIKGVADFAHANPEYRYVIGHWTNRGFNWFGHKSKRRIKREPPCTAVFDIDWFRKQVTNRLKELQRLI